MNEKQYAKFTEMLLREVKLATGEIQSIKKLLVLYLIKSGATSEEIGHAIGLDSSAVRKMLPIKRIKKLKDI